MTIDELQDFGMVPMTDDEIRDFLNSEGMGILGLPAADAPYLVPMSYGYDGETNLYFTYLLGEGSKKRELTEKTTAARFLVYHTNSPFNWESVMLTGELSQVPEAEWTALGDVMKSAWRPEMFQRAITSGDLGLDIYQFEVEDWSGLKHTGLPPEFER
ncbi:pyridoxamine 5'-phosphate oxidase family protein [Haloarchaeobius amylolyticus]|uniref:pyridoxamine 5'-phosphate oxidase family protein n=1 Tax=Haloarchaeobius amylolyticus TaxID=1198296 RepID=UPI00227101BF|nr:pyridoxamine 5'-phosphate oxidase family protein [Haloarchaeobius amylolyticus]